MALCKDPAVTYLQTLNYNVLRHPRADLTPLDVLGRTLKAVERLGPLEKIWKTSKPKPELKIVESADVKAQSTGSLRGSLGVKVLDGLLSGFGVGSIGGKFSLSGAKGMRFHFEKPEVFAADPLSIGDYLSEGDLDSANVVVGRYFYDDAADVYLVTEVLRTNKLTIEFDAENEAKANADVSALEGLLKPELEVARDKKRSTAITVATDKALCFGFKAYAVSYDEGKWIMQDFVPAGTIYMDAGQDQGITKSAELLSRGRVNLVDVL
jgi:hypothetical protein